MLQSLVHFSLRHRGVVIILAAVLLGYGVHDVLTAKMDVFPSFVQPQVVIQTECPGLAPEQVELLVTLPLETMINGLGDMESLRSESIQGLSVITAVFKEGSDIFRARQTLSEKLAETAGELPTSVKTPQMSPLTSSTMDLLKVGLVSDKLTPMQLRTFADWTLRPRMLSVPGVARCIVFGGEVREFQIQVIPERLVAYDQAISDVLAAARISTGVLGAGFVDTANQRITLQTEGQALTAQILGQVVIAHTNGFSVRLKDVAQVVEGAEPKFGDAVIMGRPGVLLSTASQYGANTLEVTRSLEAALEDMKQVFQHEGITVYSRLHRPATFIETALRNMRHSLSLGGILVAVVLFLMIGSVRTACISLAAIPLSLLAAVVALDKLGITLNTITLGGLAIALGEVVDDSIIDVENIFRRLREHQAAREKASPSSAGEPARPRRSIFQVVLDASLEVRRAVVYATFIVALIFVPILTLTGLQGSFFAPLALSYILAIMASLLVALTVTPALAYLLFGKGVKHASEPRVQRWLKAGYLRVLGFVSRWPRAVIALVLVICVLAATRMQFFGGGFLPEFREGHFVLQVGAAPGTSLQEMMRIGTRVSEQLLRNPNIASVEQQVGRAEQGEDTWPPSQSEFHVELKAIPGLDQGKIADDIRALLASFPGLQFEVLTFLGDRLSETISGETAPVVVSVFGDDLDVLDAKAKEVAKVLNGVPGHADVQVKAPPGTPRLMISLRSERLTQLGFRPVEVLEAIQTAYQGTVVAQTHRGNQVANVAVILDPQSRRDPENVGQLLLRSSQGLRMPLRELADIELSSGRYSILHEGARRRQTVTCATSGRDVSSFVEEARRQISQKVSLPPGTYVVFSGAAQAKEKAQRELLLHSAIAAVGILILLSIVFHTWRNLLLVLINIPFALVGGVLAVWLSSRLSPDQNSLTIGSLVGFVTLFGITTRNSIMMISHFEHLVTVEGMTWGAEAALRGASERLLPIIMTATVTALGLLPLAIGTGEAGREIEGPMAIVILGGLATSTALNLLVLPTLALRYGRFAPPVTQPA
ncbi:MAG TPA: efflux RND transporter permease subunit [Verrucomicrobiae bacterium]|nr:efflux RND transporter permease subunit [Verrucomicrobiae bacterium]